MADTDLGRMIIRVAVDDSEAADKLGATAEAVEDYAAKTGRAETATGRMSREVTRLSDPLRNLLSRFAAVAASAHLVGRGLERVLAINYAARFKRVERATAEAVEDYAAKTGRAETATGRMSREVTRLSDPLRNLSSRFAAVAASAHLVGRGLERVLAINYAARFERVERGLATITGSAAQGREMMDRLLEMGTRSQYQTDQLVGLARALLAVTHNGEAAVRTLDILQRAGTALGWSEGDIADVVATYSRMLGSFQAPGSETFRSLAAHGIDVTAIAGRAGLGTFTGPYATAMASMALGARPGPDAAAILIRSMDQMYRQSTDYLGIVVNTGEALRNVMLPTTRLLLPVLEAIGSGIIRMAGYLQRANEATHGLLGVMGLLRLATLVVIPLYRTVMTEVQALSVTLRDLAVSLRATTTAARAHVGAGAAATVGAGAAGAAGAGILSGLNWRAALATVGRIVAPMLGITAGEMMAQRGGAIGVAGRTLEGVVGGAVIGKQYGAIAGAILGLGYGLWEMSHSGAKSTRDTAQHTAEIARNTRQTVDVLTALRSTAYGGGSMTHSVLSDMQAERNLARAVAALSGAR